MKCAIFIESVFSRVNIDAISKSFDIKKTSLH